MNEFALIAARFKPLASDFPGSLGLSDDAALLDMPPEMQLVVTADTVNEGVHFIGDEDASLIARKALRVNLSDLAAMGAAPWCYFLALAMPGNTEESWIARFAEGLHEDQRRFGIALAGGDTTATCARAHVTITALGLVPKGEALRRRGAQADDRIYVSGTLGDAALGLRCLRNQLPRNDFLETRYLLPEPRLALGAQLRGAATACMDVSDGLAQDLGHLCAASGAGAEIWTDRLPLSGAARACAEAAEAALCGGDDYELLFTLPPQAQAPAGVTQVGIITQQKGVRVYTAQGGELLPASLSGYRHF